MDKIVYLVTIPMEDGTRIVISCQTPIVHDVIDAVNCMTMEDERAAVVGFAKDHIDELAAYVEMTEDEANEYAKKLYYQEDFLPEEQVDVDYVREYHVFAITISMEEDDEN